MRESVSATQFVVSLLSMLRQRGVLRIRLIDEQFDEAFVNAFAKFVVLAPEFGLAPEFSFAVDPLSGQSANLRDSISKAAQLRYVSLDNPEFVTVRLAMDTDDIAKVTGSGPIPHALLEDLTFDLEGMLGSSALH